MIGRLLWALAAVAALVGLPRWDNTKKTFVGGDALVSSSHGVPGTITASGNSGWLTAASINQVILTLTVAGATGTTPTLDMLVETSDDSNGATNVRTVASFTQRTGAGSERKSFVGLDDYYRVRWTVGGTSPSFTGVTLVGSSK